MNELGQIQRAIGRLEGKIDTVIGSQKRSEERQTKLEEAFIKLDSRVLAAEQDLAPLIELAEESKNWKQRGIGALAVVGIISSGITALLSTFWSQFWKG